MLVCSCAVYVHSKKLKIMCNISLSFIIQYIKDKIINMNACTYIVHMHTCTHIVHMNACTYIVHMNACYHIVHLNACSRIMHMNSCSQIVHIRTYTECIYLFINNKVLHILCVFNSNMKESMKNRSKV